jgi:hypothetical protein
MLSLKTIMWSEYEKYFIISNVSNEKLLELKLLT